MRGCHRDLRRERKGKRVTKAGTGRRERKGKGKGTLDGDGSFCRAIKYGHFAQLGHFFSRLQLPLHLH